jgi:hypothetical protein
MAEGTISMKEFEEALECPICFNVPQSTPIYQCGNGHIICKNCHEKLTNCPSCRQKLEKIRCIFAERMLQKVAVLCQFAVHGCKTRYKIGNLNDHATECLFREIQCTKEDCKARIPISRLKSHLSSSHFENFDDEEDFSNEYESDIWLYNSKHYFYRKGDIAESFIFLSHNDQLFNLEQHWIQDQKLFFFWVFFIGTPREATKYICEIKITSEDGTENHIYSGPPISIDVPFKDAKNSKQGLVFTETVAKRLLNDDNKLKFKVKIKFTQFIQGRTELHPMALTAAAQGPTLGPIWYFCEMGKKYSKKLFSSLVKMVLYLSKKRI